MGFHQKLLEINPILLSKMTGRTIIRPVISTFGKRPRFSNEMQSQSMTVQFLQGELRM